MIIAKPGESYEQHAQDVVVYRLQFEDWSADVTNPDDTKAVVRHEAKRGKTSTTTFQVLPYRPGHRWHDVKVSGGLRNSSIEVVRTVKTVQAANVVVESRRRAFTITIR